MRRSWTVLVFGALTAAASCAQIIGLDEFVDAEPQECTTGSCASCSVDDDCGEAPECQRWKCVASVCEQEDAPASTPCAEGVCAGSKCVQCVQDSDCSAGYCFDNQCFRCNDGLHNGNEAGVDCGGSCGLCLGSPCEMGASCQSGFCVDGLCCASSCNEICVNCNFLGDCVALAKYQDDDDPICNGVMTCNGGGSCLKRDGEPCLTSSECVSGVCQGTPKVCQQEP